MPVTVKKVITIFLKVILVLLVVFVIFRLLKYIVPFVLAYFFASLIEPMVKFLNKKLRIPRKVGSIFSILVVLGTIAALASFVVSRLVREARNVYTTLDINVDSITSYFNRIIDKINGIYIQLSPEISNIVNEAVQNLSTTLQSILKNITNFAQASIQFAMNLPQILIFIVVTIMATYFMSSDKTTILKFMDNQIPSDWLRKTRSITNNVFSGMFGWLRAQLIIMTITFTELVIGLSIIGIENALLIGLLIAIIDILPVLGAGTVLVPWSIINLILGHTKLGLSTFLLYVIILFVRQIIEPKIVGQQIGVHPLFTLAGMYVGLRVFGVLGMFLGPMSVIVIKYIIEGIAHNDSFKNWFERNFRARKDSNST